MKMYTPNTDSINRHETSKICTIFLSDFRQISESGFLKLRKKLILSIKQKLEIVTHIISQTLFQN